jgi:hypothetical protein
MSNWFSKQQRREVELAATRVVEVLDSFRMVNRRLCDELLDCLGRLGPDELYQLFGRSDDHRSPAPAPAAKAHEVADQPAVPPVTLQVVDKPTDPHAGWKWDPDTGRRLWPRHRSAFNWARNSERPPSGRTHWSD